MRRLLKDIAKGRALGDTTTLADPTVVARLRELRGVGRRVDDLTNIEKGKGRSY
ncbi:MAG TPA: hypothetical protein VHG08_16945 [Longimicrobium sp.]|nr:hypothetical protein [Longimicrobium sp.]